MSKYPIKGTLNIFLSLSASVLAVFLLWLASHAQSFLWTLGAAVIFSFVANTLFSLLHESVHGIFHSHKKVNDLFGILSASFFPTSFTFQKHCHLGHHRRNRTDVEMFDLYYPSDQKWVRQLQLYWILLGFYWTSAPLGCLVYLFSPWILSIPFLRKKSSRIVQQIGMDAMISSIEEANPVRTRLEILFALSFQVGLFFLLDLSLLGWGLCYALFAVNWSSLQYTDHAFSPRDVLNGAWNLKTSKLVRLVFLNYHCHQVHHRNPKIPWHLLPMYVDKSKNPSFWSIYCKLWKGPQLTTEPSPSGPPEP